MKEVLKPVLELEVIPVRSSNAERWWEVEVVVVVVEEEADMLLLLLLLLLFCWTNSEIFLKSEVVVVVDGKAKLRSWPWWIILLSLLLGFWVVCDKVGGVMTRSAESFLLVELLSLWWLLLLQEAEDLLFFLEPPPTGMFLRVPPSVQYLLQQLQPHTA